MQRGGSFQRDKSHFCPTHPGRTRTFFSALCVSGDNGRDRIKERTEAVGKRNGESSSPLAGNKMLSPLTSRETKQLSVLCYQLKVGGRPLKPLPTSLILNPI